MLVSTVYTAKWTPCNEILHFNRELDKQVLINVFHKACDINLRLRKMHLNTIVLTDCSKSDLIWACVVEFIIA